MRDRVRLVLVLCVGLSAACERQRNAANTPASEEVAIPVAASAATIGSIRDVLHVSGVVAPAEGAEFLVHAPEPARVLEISKAEGEMVTARELLVRLDIPSAGDDLDRRRADAAAARAAVENARVTQTRLRDLADRGFVARRELEHGDRALADAQAALAAAEAAQAAAEATAARAMLRAPFAGVVTHRLHEPGDLVQGAVTDPILRIVDPGRLEVVAAVPAGDLSRVLPGNTARLASGGATPVRLTVVSRPGAGQQDSSGSLQVRLAAVDGMPLAVDTPVQVDIDLEERVGAVLVPLEAVVGEGAGAAVFVAAGDRAQRRAVLTGVADESRIEITSGVRAGELVITRGQTGLESGALISVDTAAR